MGITFDIIPMGPGEAPEAAIARVYEGGISIDWVETDDGWAASAATPQESVGPRWRPPQGWRDPLVERVAALHDWQREDTDEFIYFWHSDVLWQVEFGPEDVTFRRRRGVGDNSRGPTDADLLRVFADLPAVVHQPANGWSMTLDEIDDDFELLG